MSALRELQLAFAQAILDDDDGAVVPLIVSDSFPGARRLNVYRNNVVSSLTAALSDTFPVVKRLVGAEFFRHLAREYLRAHPSTSGNLHDFGAGLPEFLDFFGPAAQLPYLADVARLERAWHEVFHSPEPPEFPFERLASIDTTQHERLRFRLSPASRLLTSPFPVLRIWELNQPGACGEATLSLDEGGDHLLVIRRDLDVEFHRLAPAEFVLLASLERGNRLGDACEAASTADASYIPAHAFERHARLGTLVDFDIDVSRHTSR